MCNHHRLLPESSAVGSGPKGSAAGFTLLELLVATALGMVVMGLAVTAYRHSQALIKRTEALVRLHRKAGDIAELWEKDIACLLQHVACNGAITYDGVGKTKAQLTVMRSLREFWESSRYDLPYDVDLAWVRWEWRAANRSLTRAQSPPPHQYVWYPNLAIFYITDTSIPFRPVIGMRPSAVRTYAEFLDGKMRFHDPMSLTPAAIREVRIFDRLFLTGVDADGVTRTYKGMEAEHTKNPLSGSRPNDEIVNDAMGWNTWSSEVPARDQARLLADGVEDFTFSIECRNGTMVVDSGSGFNQSIDGEMYDGRDAAAAGSRPRLVHLKFALVDSAVGLRQSFSFVSRAP